MDGNVSPPCLLFFLRSETLVSLICCTQSEVSHGRVPPLAPRLMAQVGHLAIYKFALWHVFPLRCGCAGVEPLDGTPMLRLLSQA